MVEGEEESGKEDKQSEGTSFTRRLRDKTTELMLVEELDHETSRMTEWLAVLRIATKHINLWTRQLEMKRKEMSELAGLMKLEEVKKEIVNEKSLEKWAKRCSHHFTKMVKRKLFEEIDNMVWSGDKKEITQWCKKNKVFDVITDVEIEEIWREEDLSDDEPIRLNGKFVWETAKRVCDYINAHEDLIRITTFGEYRVVMMKVMRVIREAHNTERKRRQSSRKKKSDDAKTRTQRTKSLICDIKRGRLRKEDIGKRLEEIFGKGSGEEIRMATTMEKIVERIEEMSKREEQFDKWEQMRLEAKRKQREVRRLNIFWRRKMLPSQIWK